ncbi:MAG: hypothetical protein EOM50_02155 [Erysipelotrichia bacterium]|nr:hypothetical protein [Erysipelotrichia bacterium]
MSKNIFEIKGDTIAITRNDWKYVAYATVKDDYIEEIQSVSWSLNNDRYLQSSLGSLHGYIMKKWYSEEIHEQMMNSRFVVDHIDNQGWNCRIDNLCYLSERDNKAKGFTFDINNKDKNFIALTITKDFYNELFQISIVFNYPSVLNLKDFKYHSVINLAYLLYDLDYKMVLHDGQGILDDYLYNFEFRPDKLKFIDYYIEGQVGKPIPLTAYLDYLKGSHGHAIAFFRRKQQLYGWTKESKQEYFRIFDRKQNKNYNIQLNI